MEGVRGVVGEVGVRRVVGVFLRFDSEKKGRGLFICLKGKRLSVVYIGAVSASDQELITITT
jgi:hypothetical protein